MDTKALPAEIRVKVMKYLNYDNLLNLGGTCRFWRLETERNELWSDVILTLPEPPTPLKFTDLNGRCPNKLLYLRYRRIMEKWKNASEAPLREISSELGYNQDFSEWWAGGNKILFVNSNDHSVRIFCTTNGERLLLFTYPGCAEFDTRDCFLEIDGSLFYFSYVAYQNEKFTCVAGAWDLERKIQLSEVKYALNVTLSPPPNFRIIEHGFVPGTVVLGVERYEEDPETNFGFPWLLYDLKNGKLLYKIPVGDQEKILFVRADCLWTLTEIGKGQLFFQRWIFGGLCSEVGFMSPEGSFRVDEDGPSLGIDTIKSIRFGCTLERFELLMLNRDRTKWMFAVWKKGSNKMEVENEFDTFFSPQLDKEYMESRGSGTFVVEYRGTQNTSKVVQIVENIRNRPPIVTTFRFNFQVINKSFTKATWSPVGYSKDKLSHLVCMNSDRTRVRIFKYIKATFSKSAVLDFINELDFGRVFQQILLLQ